MKVQSVIVDKHIFTPTSATKWLKDNGFKFKKVDETVNYYRFRQFDPKKNDKYITKDIHNGVKLILSN